MRYFLSFGVKIGVVLAFSASAFALPTVESRTGEPLTRTSTASAVEESHTAHLTLTQIEALKQEIGELRGLIEVQDHEIKQLKKSQQDLFLDLEKRLTQLKTQTSSATSSNTPPSAGNKKILIIPKGKTSAENGESRVKLIPKESSTSGTTSVTPGETSLNHNATLPTTEKEVYEAAYKLVGNRQYPEAITALEGYLNRFPNGEHTPNAHYWLGEVYVIQWQRDNTNIALLDKATQAFSSIINQYPTHPKAIDALLKMGLVESDKGNFESARHYLTEVKTQFPGTAAARIAEARLQQITD
jgi:tol-pal system protein YbgF